MKNKVNYYKRREFKDKLKQNWKVLVGTGAFVLSAIIGLLIGFSMNGWSLIRWLKSDYAVTCIILLILGAIGFAGLVYVFFIVKQRR